MGTIYLFSQLSWCNSTNTTFGTWKTRQVQAKHTLRQMNGLAGASCLARPQAKMNMCEENFGCFRWNLVLLRGLVRPPDASLTTKWRCGGTYAHLPSLIFLPPAFWLVFFEAVGNMVPSLGRFSRTSNLLFNKRYFRKTLFFLAYHHLISAL